MTRHGIPQPGPGPYKKRDGWWVYNGYDLLHGLEGWVIRLQGVEVGHTQTIEQAIEQADTHRRMVA